MPFKSNHFNEGQRVWIVSLSGDQAAYCYGKFRGKNKYVYAWVRWKSKHLDNPKIEQFEITEAFLKRIFKY